MITSTHVYHGTRESAIASGPLALRPRGTQPGNWFGNNPSHPDDVYLTDGYAGYFANVAHSKSDEPGDRWAIVEVQLDRLHRGRMMPDEDWLEQVTRGSVQAATILAGKSMEDRTAWFREHKHEWQSVWHASLADLGTCSHRGIIPAEAITRIAYVEPHRQKWFAMTVIDPAICLMNHALLGSKYRALTRWLFDGGDDRELAELITFGDGMQRALAGVMSEFVDATQEQLRNRDGIEIDEVTP